MLSPAVEDYIKTIFILQDGVSKVSTTEIARAMKVAAPSVTGMLKRLVRLKMVYYESYKGVRLTVTGEQVALEMVRHHRLLETYLREVLGYSWGEMHSEADHLEHHISERFEARIDALLGYPTHDPHGHPIPTRDLKMVCRKTLCLGEAEAGRLYVVREVCDGDVSVLDMLESSGLLPGRKVEVLDRGSGDVTVRIDGSIRTISSDIAGSVHVGGG